MPHREYLILLDVDVRKRHYHEVQSGRIQYFMVQLEIKHSGKWKPVLRYDSAHDFAHKDSYNLRGETRKINLYMDYDDALTYADDDISDNWEFYKERFLKGEFP